MSEPQTPASLLRRARELLILHGWTTGWYENVAGCHCAVGALLTAAHVGPGEGLLTRNVDNPKTQLVERAAGYLADLTTVELHNTPIYPNCEMVIQHNDAAIKDFDEALEWFDEAIRYAENDA